MCVIATLSVIASIRMSSLIIAFLELLQVERESVLCRKFDGVSRNETTR